MGEKNVAEESLDHSPWQIITGELEAGFDHHKAAREHARLELALQEGRARRVTAGAVELRPSPGSITAGRSRQIRYRLRLVREEAGWRLVTERSAADWPPNRRPRCSSTYAESLGEVRSEVERLWGPAVWAALLRASSRTLQVMAPFLLAGHASRAGGLSLAAAGA
ncbi:MAG TPA: hypothetical protein VE991_13310 [Acidimicrobiales bacterium]|nr:hypothetical protein [Acidimicrobiales bacterium]